MAGWILKPSIIEQSHNYLRWKLHVVIGTGALSATDIFSETYMPRDMKSRVQGHTYMRMDYVPHKTSLAPNTEGDITLSNTVSTALFTGTTTAADEDETFDLSTDIAMYPTFYSKMYLTVDDLGDANDYFDLYFECWKESGNA